MNYISERRLEEKERRRAEILDAAEQVATSTSLAEMTMDQVARQARLSRALIYVYFQDKDELVLGICSRAMDRLIERFTEASSRHRRGIDQVRAIGRAYIAFAYEFPLYFKALSRYELRSTTAHSTGEAQVCLRHGHEVHEIVARAVATGVADGSIRKDVGPPILVSLSLWAMTHGAIQIATTKAAVIAHDGVTPQQLTDHALEMATRALAP